MGTTPDFPLIGPPRISTLGFTEVLRSNRSPATPEALYAYRAALDQGVDPAVLLAVFRKESTFGRFGKANRNRSWGNIRDPQTGAFRAYQSWTDGARDAARLLAVYGRNQIRPGRNTSTVQTMPYVWAPAADGNGPDRYGDQLARWIGEWQRKHPASGSGAGLPPPTGVPTSTDGGQLPAWGGIVTFPVGHVVTTGDVDSMIDKLRGAGFFNSISGIAAWQAEQAARQVLTTAIGRRWDKALQDDLQARFGAAAVAAGDPLSGIVAGIGGVLSQVVVNGTLLAVVVGLGWSGLNDLLGGEG